MCRRNPQQRSGGRGGATQAIMSGASQRQAPPSIGDEWDVRRPSRRSQGADMRPSIDDEDIELSATRKNRSSSSCGDSPNSKNGTHHTSGAQPESLELGEPSTPQNTIAESSKRITWWGAFASVLHWPKHLIVFMVLTALHAFALLVFKLNVVDGDYPFSSASTLVATEGFKLVLATGLHRREIANMAAASRPGGLVASFRATATPGLWMSTFVISAMYTVNNLLSYFCVAQMDPGTLAIAKALVPYLTALVLQLFGRAVNDLQWVCIVLQCTGVASTQFHPSSTPAEKAAAVYNWDNYFWLACSVAITTLSSVWNERIIKKYKAPLQQINMIMYFFGVILAAIIYAAIPEYHSKGFFEGWSIMVGILIFVQATYGLAVGYAYKYADVLIKNLSTSATLALLVGLSAMFFNKPLTFNTIVGSVIIICTSYIYMKHAHKTIQEREACVPLRRCCASILRLCQPRRFSPLDDERADTDSGFIAAFRPWAWLTLNVCSCCLVLGFFTSVYFYWGQGMG